MNKLTTIQRFIIFAFLVIGIASCSSGTKQEKESATTEKADTQAVKVEESERTKQIKQIFHSLPSPIELTFLFKQEGVQYSADKLHDVGAIGKYNISRKQAMNLGVYGADLSYAGIFENHQDALKYYNSCKQLTEALGIEESNYSTFITRLENNQENKDTILSVISDFFLLNNANLKDNEQEDLATYALVGGWVEGMYLGTQLAAGNGDMDGIKSILIMQKHSLQSLIQLVEGIQNSEDENLVNQMNQLFSLYDNIETKKADTDKNKVEKKDGKLILNTSKTIANIPDDIFLEIKSKIAALRSTIIK